MSDDEKYQAFVKSAFEAAGLPEVEEHELEPGTYTNAQIAEKMRHDPLGLLSMLMKVADLGSSAEKRSILSFAVDLIEEG